MKTTKHLAVLVFAATVVSAFGGPPTDQGFWTFFKEGVKDDLTLVGLGMRAGLRVFVPGWAVVDDIIRGDDPLEDLAELSYDASGEVVDFLRTSEGRKTVARFAKVPKKGEGMKYVTKKSKDLFKAAKWIGWVGTGVDSFIELADAKETADKYLAAREREYERMRRANAAKKAADESRRTTPDFSTLETLVDRQVAYIRGLLAAGQKATRARRAGTCA